jgi:hypothetical protein
MGRHLLRTGANGCFDAAGEAVPCAGTLQDGELMIGLPVPEPRFVVEEGSRVLDRYTGLCWPRDAAVAEFPVRWSEGLELVRELNRQGYLGCTDWRMPNRRELRSLIWHSASRPALPPDHPFRGLKQTWYWSSTSSAMYPAYAWYVHLEGGRMFWGRKDQFYMLLPVRSHSQVLPRTGQTECFGDKGGRTDCARSGQDAEALAGAPWPEPRFEARNTGVLDRLTDLIWYPQPDLPAGPVDWEGALELVRTLNQTSVLEWHLPNINELESLVDASRHSPALPAGHPFAGAREVYWSSTTSGFETDWAYGLYLHKGAVGVGHKTHARFAVWPVAENTRDEGSGQESLSGPGDRGPGASHPGSLVPE